MKPDGTLPDGLVASVSTLPPKETVWIGWQRRSAGAG